jgi:uncharacterized protein (DUF1697 family)
MKTWIALFRGINVGGHGKLPMKELVAEMEALGLSDVRTYIQSGNAVFRSERASSSKLAGRLARAIEASHGFLPQVIVLSLEAFEAAAAASPFPKSDAADKTVHLLFLSAPATDADVEAMNRVKASSEEFELASTVLYLHTPDGFGRSKLATKVERLLGVPATGRNWRSVTKILELARSSSKPER